MNRNNDQRSEIHAVIFNKFMWSTLGAKVWLRHHNLEPIKQMRETKNYYRYRIRDPKKYSHFSTINTDAGIKLIIGYF